MEIDELRHRLRLILAAEEREPPNWLEVKRLSSELLPQLHIDATPDIVRHYLDDADIRARDDAYSFRQRREIRRFVKNGSYDDGQPIPFWVCVIALLLVISFGVWAFL